MCISCLHGLWFYLGVWWAVAAVLSYLSPKREKNTQHKWSRKTRAASCDWGLKAFPSVFSSLWRDEISKKKTLLNPTSLFTVRAEFRAIVHCIYVRHPERLGWSLSSHYVPLCLPSTMSAGFGEMFLLQYVFLFFDKLIRAAELKRLFQICTSTHTHTFEFEHLERQTLHSPASPLIFFPSLMFCRFQLKRCWPLKSCQQNQSTMAFIRSNHKACVGAWMWILCLCQFMMYLLIMGNTFLCSDSL